MLDGATQPAIRATGIGKSFAGVSVLRDISLEIRPGEIHGLCGENGAGKSTLGKLLGGYYSLSAGSLEVFGQSVPMSWDSRDALAHGIAIMHQELQLVPALTVAQNVFLGIEEHSAGVLKNTEADRLNTLAKSAGFNLDPHAVVSDLSIADQQKIEILRALARNARVIVMDEPTSSLSKVEVEQLHTVMESLRDAGCAVIYVSHFLDDIMAVTNRITVLRDGGFVDTLETSEINKSQLVGAILGGGKSETKYPAKNPPSESKVVLDVQHIQSNTGVKDASLKIHAGEIVALIGLVGSGRREIARVILGADPATGGNVTLDGAPYSKRNVRLSTERGLVMVPEDRRAQGLVLTMPVRANVTIANLGILSRFGWIDQRKEQVRVQETIDYFDIHPSTIDGDIANYSGGNQQKALIGKWLMNNPGVVILDEPSRGVDVGARARIHEAVAEVAATGAGVLLISSEMEEALALANRAYVIHDGKTVLEINPDDHTEASILRLLFEQQGITND